MSSDPNSLSQNDTNPYASGFQQPTTVISAEQPTMAAPQLTSNADENSGQSKHAEHGNAGGHFAEVEPERKSKKPLITLGIVVLLLVAAYGGGVYAFSNICYPNTSIAGVDVSLMTRKTAEHRVSASTQSYKLSVEGDDFNWTYTPESPEDIIDASAAVDRVISANEPFAWPVHLVQALLNQDDADSTETIDLDSINIDDIKLPASFDRDAFSTSLKEAVDAFNENHPGTFDAVGAYDEETGTFTLDKARSNQKLNQEAIEKLALVALSRLTKTVELDDSCRIPLANDASDEQMQAALDEANKLIGTDVDLIMGGDAVATLDGATLATWITFDEDLNPTLNADMVTTWVHDLAANQLDTAGTDREYTRPDGKQIVIGGGTFGWVADEEQLIQLLHNAVAEKQTGSIEIPLKQAADIYTGAGKRDWDTYIDIDLSEQYARFYDASDNIVWESHIISGNVNTGHGTPTGIYKLNNKARNVTLVGADEDHDDEPDYKTPVSYWMPFVGGAVGLHDADWQSDAAFADPSAYGYRGSHGCINLPPSKAAELYDVIEIGTCVIVHW